MDLGSFLLSSDDKKMLGLLRTLIAVNSMRGGLRVCHCELTTIQSESTQLRIGELVCWLRVARAGELER